MSALPNVRNAARDVAEGLRRFERDFERLQRTSKAALEEGHSSSDVAVALNESLKGHPDLAVRNEGLHGATGGCEVSALFDMAAPGVVA